MQGEIVSCTLFFSFTCPTGKLAKYKVLTNINKIISRRKLSLLLLQQNKIQVKKAFALFQHLAIITALCLIVRTSLIAINTA